MHDHVLIDKPRVVFGKGRGSGQCLTQRNVSLDTPGIQQTYQYRLSGASTLVSPDFVIRYPSTRTLSQNSASRIDGKVAKLRVKKLGDSGSDSKTTVMKVWLKEGGAQVPLKI